jgi:hypothetical protein
MKAQATVKVMAGVAALMFANFAQAESATVVSPDKAQVDVAGYIEKACFAHFGDDPALYADVTFSNAIYVGDGQSLSREYSVFKFPGVTFDPATKTFYAKGDGEKRVPVAMLEDTWFGQRIRPLQGTCVYIGNRSGTLQLKLTATTNPLVNRANHWVTCSGTDFASGDSLSTR